MNNLPSNNNISANWCIPGIVMKSALVPGKLSVCCVNSQSLCARQMTKFNEFKQMILMTNVDIICVSETWLNDRIDSSIIAIDGYKIVRNDRVGRIGGGVLIYVRYSLICKVLELSDNEIGETEFIICEIIIQNRKKLFGVFYNPPEHDCSEIIDMLLCRYGTRYEGIYLLGDFNTNLQNSNVPKTIRLQEVFSTHGLVSIGNEPTFFHTNGSSQLDLFVCNDPSHILRFNQVDVPVLSNHDMIFASLDIETAQLKNSFQYRNYDRVNLDALRVSLETVNWENLYRIHDVDLQMEMFNSIICDLHDQLVPLQTINKNRKSNPWFNNDIARSIVVRDLSFRQWKVRVN